MAYEGRPRNPKTPEEWQEAADSAYFLLIVDSARQYGLIETDMRPNIDRCERILRLAEKRGIKPRKEWAAPPASSPATAPESIEGYTSTTKTPKRAE